MQSLLCWLETCFGGNSPRECPGTPLIICFCKIQNGSLLQFADDTCLTCYGDDHTQVKDFLSSDLDSLARWIAASKKQVNVEKFRVMWFSVESSKYPTTVPPILLEGTPLVNASKQKYLGIPIDSNLTWGYHVANVCKKMAYFLF